MSPSFEIRGRRIGQTYRPLVVAEIGINHEGDIEKAKRMVRDAHASGAECVKFQSHVIEDEMVPSAKHVIPGNATESIWTIMERCAFSEAQEREMKSYVEKLGMMFLSTPFSRAAADRLHRMNVDWYKIGSGECNNYPLIDHIASFGKPVIVSTGMNNMASVAKTVAILRKKRVPYALLHCTSVYPTPYKLVRLGALAHMQKTFPDAVIGLSDHSESIYPCLGASALGASILERHFTSDKTWPGPDIEISMDPAELKQLIAGVAAIHASLGGSKEMLKEEQPTIDFAYACVVAIKDIGEGEPFTKENLWVKRPGTGEIKAVHYEKVLGKRAKRRVANHSQIRWEDVS